MERVGWLVTTLLKLAKADAGAIRVQAAPVDVERIVRDALAPLAGAFDLRGEMCIRDSLLTAPFRFVYL